MSRRTLPHTLSRFIPSVLVLILSCYISTTYCASIYVDSSASCPCDGSEPSPYVNIADAVSGASSGDIVLLASGVYQGPLNTRISINAKSLTIKRKSAGDHPRVACGGNVQGFALDGSSSDSYTIEGISFQDCIASDGGAVSVKNSASLTLTDTVFINCLGIQGGAVYAAGVSSGNKGTLTLSNCTFNSNQAEKGGAVFSIFSDLTDTDSTYNNNVGSDMGGAVYFSLGDTSFTDVTFTGNTYYQTACVGSTVSLMGSTSFGGRNINLCQAFCVPNFPTTNANYCTARDAGLRLENGVEVHLGEGSTSTYSLSLNQAPSASVTVTLSSVQPRLTVGTPSLTFSTSTWSDPQTVTVTAVEDTEFTGPAREVIVHSFSAGASEYTSGGLVLDYVARVVDNDPGVILSSTTVSIDEGATVAEAYNIRLSYCATVNVSLSANAVRLTPTVYGGNVAVFDSSTCDFAQIVQVVAIDNGDGEGTVYVPITHSTSSGTGSWNGLTVDSVNVTINDDDVGIVATPLNRTAVEGEGSVAFSLTLRSAPSSDVTITVQHAGSDLALSTSSVVIAAAQWNNPAANTFTVSAIADGVGEGPHSAYITLNSTSAQGIWDGLMGPALRVDITDRDLEIIVTPLPLDITVPEGSSVNQQIKLKSAPTANVTITATLDPTRVSTSPVTLTFTPSNWNVAQVISLTAIDNTEAHGEVNRTVRYTSTSSQGLWNGISSNITTITIPDNDITVQGISATLVLTEAGPSGSIYLTLGGSPSAPVTVSITPSKSGEVTLNVTSILFTAADWNVPRGVLVTAIDDNLGEGNHSLVLTYTLSSSDSIWAPVLLPTTTVTITDTGVGVVICRTVAPDCLPGSFNGRLDISEGGTTATVTVALIEQPLDSVNVTLQSLDASNTLLSATPSPTAAQVLLSFTVSDWNITQTVTITAVDDIDAEGPHSVNITSITSSSNAAWDNVHGPQLSADITDNDLGVTVANATGLTSDEATSAPVTYTLVLNGRPASDVTVVVAGDSDLNTNVASLVFTSASWSTAQTISTTAVDDNLAEGPHQGNVTHSIGGSSDAVWLGLNVDAVTVDIIDNDIALNLNTNMASVSETQPSTAQVQVMLQGQPTAPVTVTFTDNSAPAQVQLGVTPTFSNQLTFNVSDWNVVQIMTIRAVDDTDAESSHQTTLVVTTSSSDAVWNTPTTTQNVTVSIADNDISVLVSPVAVSTQEGGSYASYSVQLGGRPSNGETVTVTFTPDSESVVSDTTTPLAGAGTLNFTAANWNVAQNVYVWAVQDDVGEGTHNSTITHTSSSPTAYWSGLSITAVTNIIQDDDIQVIVSPTTLALTEGGSDGSYTVVLSGIPSSPVVIHSGPNNIRYLDVANSTSGLANDTLLSFTAADWSNPQVVSVRVVDDTDGIGPQNINITHTVVQGPSEWLAISIADVLVSLTDDDMGVILTPTSLSLSENGGVDTFTVRLRGRPVSNVVVALLGVGGQTEVSVDGGSTFAATRSLTFTPAAWNIAQAVQAQAIDDSFGEGVHNATISVSIPTGPSAWTSLPASSVQASIVDNDVDIVVTTTPATIPPFVTMAEEGPVVNYQVSLSSAPASDVTIAISAPATQVSLTTSSLTFTTLNWNLGQSVGAQAVSDILYEGVHEVLVQHQATSGDPVWAGLGINATAVITDDPNDGVAVSLVTTSTSVSATGAGEYLANTTDLAIGEHVLVDLVLKVPEANPIARVNATATCPSGMVVANSTVSRVPSQITGSVLAVGNAGTLSMGNTVAFFNFGTLSNPTDGAVNADDHITVQIDCVVQDVVGNAQGTLLVIQADAAADVTSDSDVLSFEVVEPRVTITSFTAPVLPVSPGSPVTFTAVFAHPGSSTATAFNVTVDSKLTGVGSRWQFIPGSVLVTTPASYQLLSGAVASDTDFSLLIPNLGQAQSVQVSYQATLLAPVPAGIIVPTTIEGVWFSTDTTVLPRRQYQISATTNVTTSGLTVTSSVSNTSFPETTRAYFDSNVDDVAIGEEVSVEYVISSDGLSVENATLQLSFPATGSSTSFVVTSAIITGGGMNSSLLSLGSSATLSRLPGSLDNDNTVTFDFGQLSSSGFSTLNITIKGRLLDIPNHVDGMSLVISGSLSHDPSTVILQDTSVEVVLPLLQASKTGQFVVSGGNLGDAADLLEYTVQISHVAGTSHAPAFVLNFTDLIPADTVMMAGSATTTVGTVSHNGPDYLAVDLPQYDLGSPAIEIKYRVSLNDSVGAEVNVTNLGTVDYYTSTVVAEARALAASDTHTISVANTPVLALSAIDSSLSITGLDKVISNVYDALVSESITLQATITLPEGESRVRLVLTTNTTTNLNWDITSSRVAWIGSNVLYSALAVDQAGITTDTNADGFPDTIEFDFGTVVNQGDNVINANDTLVAWIDVAPLVPVNGAVAFGQTYIHWAQVFHYQTAPVVRASERIDVVGPILDIIASNNLPTGDAGDIVTYELRVRHNSASTGPAYALNITDAIQPGKDLVQGSVTVNVPAVISNGTRLDIFVESYNLSSPDIVVTYQARVNETTGYSFPVLNGTGNVEWWSSPLDFWPKAQDRTSDTSSTAIDYIPKSLVVDILAGETSLNTTTLLDLAVGESFVVRSTVTLAEGTSYVRLETILPSTLAGTGFGTGAVQVTGSRVVSLGDNLSYNPSTLNAYAVGDQGLYLDVDGPVGVPEQGVYLFGDIVNYGDNVINGNDTFVVEVYGYVRDLGTTANCETLLTRVNLNYTDYDVNSFVFSDTLVRTVEPILNTSRIAQFVSQVTPVSSDIIQIDIVVDHVVAPGCGATSNSDAFEITIVDTIASTGFTLIPGSVNTTVGTILAGNGGSDTNVTVFLEHMTRAQSITVSYLAQVDNSDANLQTAFEDSVILVDYRSYPDPPLTGNLTFGYAQPYPQDGGRGYQSTPVDNVLYWDVAAPVLTIDYVASSLPETGTSQYNGLVQDVVIGERVTWRVNITAQSGLTRLSLRLASTVGLSILNATLETVGADLKYMNASVGLSMDLSDTNADGHFDDANLDIGHTLAYGPDRSITVLVECLALDVPSSVAGAVIDLNTYLNVRALRNIYQDVVIGSHEVVTPVLVTSLTSNVTSDIDAGDFIEFVMSLQHDTTSTGPAYHVEIGDVITAYLVLQPTYTSINASVPFTVVSGQTAGESIVNITAQRLPLNDYIVITFVVRVDETVGYLTPTIAKSGQWTWASGLENGRPDSQSQLVTLTIARDPQYTFAIVSSSNEYTQFDRHNVALPDISVGETVTYRMNITYREGTGFANLTLSAPNGIDIISSNVTRVGTSISGTALNVGDQAVVSSGLKLAYFDFGVFVNAGDNVKNDEDMLSVQAIVRVADNGATVDAATLTIDTVADYSVSSYSESLSSQVVVPVLNSGTTAIFNRTISILGQDYPVLRFTTIVSHDVTSSTAAFDVNITDALGPYLSIIPGSIVSNFPARASVSNVTGGPSLFVSIPVFDRAAGDLVLVYDCVYNETSAAAQSIFTANTANIPFRSHPDAFGRNGVTNPGTVLFPAVVTQNNLIVSATSNPETASDKYNTSNTDATIGEVITLRKEMTVTSGSTRLSIQYDLDTSNIGVLRVVRSNVSHIGSRILHRQLNPGASGVESDVQGSDGLLDRVLFDFGWVTSIDDGVSNAQDKIWVEVEVEFIDVVVNKPSTDATVIEANQFTSLASTYPSTSSQTMEIVGPDVRISLADDQVTAGDAGDVLTFTVTLYHDPSSIGPAYSLTVEQVFSNLFELLPGTVFSNDGTLSATKGNSSVSDNTVQVLIPTFELASPNITVTFQVRFNETVGYLTPNIGLLSALQYYSNPSFTGRVARTNATTSVSVTNTPLATAMAISRTSSLLTGVAQHDGSRTDLLIGEIMYANATITLREGTSRLLVTLQTSETTVSQMAVVTSEVTYLGSSITQSSLAQGAAASVADLASVALANDTVTFDFGEVVNTGDNVVSAADEIHMEIGVLFTDVPSNSDGDLGSAQVTFDYSNGTQSYNLYADLVEPVLALRKESEVIAANDGIDVVRVSYYLSHLPRSTGAAYDVVVKDTFSADFNIIPGAAVTPVGSIIKGNVSGDTSFELNIPSYLLTDSPSLIQFDLNFTATQPGFAEEVGDLSWTSGPRGRSNTSTAIPTLWRADFQNITLAVDRSSNIANAFDQLNSGLRDLSVGEVATLKTGFRLISGTSDVTITVQVPPFLQITGSRVSELGSALRHGVLALNSPATTSDQSGNGILDTAVFGFGYVTELGSTDTASSSVYMEVDVLVRELPGSIPGTSFATNVSARHTSLEFTQINTTQIVTEIVQPYLNLSTVLSPGGAKDAADVVIFSVESHHLPSSSAAAYDVNITVPLSPQFLLQSATLVVNKAHSVIEGGVDSANSVVIYIPTFTLNSGPIVITFTTTLNNTVGPSPTVGGTTQLVWDSATGDLGRRDSVSDTFSVAINNTASFDSTLSSTSVANTTSGTHASGVVDMTIGEVVVLDITVQLSEGLSSIRLEVDTVGPAVLELQNITTTLHVGSNLQSSTPYQVGDSLYAPSNGDMGTSSLSASKIVWDFGSITNIGDNVIDDGDRVRIRVQAVLTATGVNVDGAAAGLNSNVFSYGTSIGTQSHSIRVVEPTLYLETSSSRIGSVIDAGTVVDFSHRIGHRNFSTSSAFAVTFTDTPGQYFEIDTSSVVVSPSYGVISVTPSGVSVSYQVLSLNQGATILYSARYNETVRFDVPSITTAPSTSYRSSPQTVYRTYNVANNTANPVDLTPLGFAANITDSSAVETQSEQLNPLIEDMSIFETATYEFNFTLAEGTSSISVTLNTTSTASTMSFISASILQVGSKISGLTAGTPLVLSDSNNDTFSDIATLAAREVVNIGDNVVNQEDQIRVRLVAQVPDTSDNSPGSQITIEGTLNYVNGALSGSRTVELVGPLLNLESSVNTSVADGGDYVLYTLNVTHAPTSTGPAFQTNVTFNFLPFGDLVVGSLTIEGPSYTVVSGNTTNDTSLDLRLPVLSLSGTNTLFVTFVLQLKDTYVGFATPVVTSSAEVRWDCFTGYSCAFARATSSNAIAIENKPTFSHSVFRTSNPLTGSTQHVASYEDLSVGEIITFRTVITLKEGISTVLARQSVPYPYTVMAHLNSSIVSIGGNVVTSSNEGDAGQQFPITGFSTEDIIFFSLSNVRNAGDNVVDDRDNIVVEISTIVRDVGASSDGAQFASIGSFITIGQPSSSVTDTLEVVEPALAVNATITPVPPVTSGAGDIYNVTIQFTHLSTSTSAAFDLELDCSLGNDVTFVSGSASVTSGGSAEATGTGIGVSIPTIVLGATAIVNYQVRLNETVGFDIGTVTIKSNSTYSSHVRHLTTQERILVLPVNDLVVGIDAVPEINVTVSGTSNAFTAGTALSVGERIVFTHTATLKEGTSKVTFEETLPVSGVRLGLVQWRVVSQGANIAPLDGAPVANVTDTNADGADDYVSVSFGRVVNSGDNVGDGKDQIVVEFEAVVTSWAGNTPGATASVGHGLDYTIGEHTSTTGVSIVGPDLDVGTSVSPSTGDAGDLITVTVVVGHASGSTSGAYGVNVTVPLGAAVHATSVADSVAVNSTALTIVSVYGNSTAETDRVFVHIDTLPLGSAVAITFQARLNESVGFTVPTVSLSGQLDWSSDASEGGRDLSATPSVASVTVAADPTIAVVLTSTSNAFTAGTALSVGERIVFTHTATLKEGTSKVTFEETLPVSGVRLGLVQWRVVSQGANIAPLDGAPVANVTDTNADGADDYVSVSFGRVVNSGDNVGDGKDQIVVEFEAVVTSWAGNTPGATASVGHGLDYTIGEHTSTTGVSIVGPDLDVGTSVSPSTGDAGDLITVTVVVGHASGSTSGAYDVNVTVPLGAAVHATSVADSVAVNSTALTIVSVYGNATGQSDRVYMHIDTLPLGSAVAITFQARLSDSVGYLVATVSVQGSLAWRSEASSAGRTGTASSLIQTVSIPSTPFSYTIVNVTTNEASTGSSKHRAGVIDVVPGETIEVLVRLVLREGTSRPTFGATVPSAPGRLSILDGRSAGLGSTSFSAPTPGTNSTAGVNDGVEIVLGQVVNPGDNVVDDGDRLLYTARVLTTVDPVTSNGDEAYINSTLDYVNGTFAVSVLADIVEPALGVIVTSNVSRVDADFSRSGVNENNNVTDAIGYTITVYHLPSSTADAFDLSVIGLVDPDLILTGAAVGFSGGSGSALISGGSVSDTQVQLTSTSLLLGTNITLSYSCYANLTVETNTTANHPTTVEWASRTPIPRRVYSASDSVEVLINLPGPRVTALVANDPDDGDRVLSNGDTIQIYFSEATNTPSVSSKADIDSLFAFTKSLGAAYTGTWTNSSLVTITLANVTTADVAIGNMVVRVIGDIRNSIGDSVPSIFTSPQLVGDFGRLPPQFTSFLADDPDNLDAVFSDGDTLVVLFDVDTNVPAVSNAAEIRAQFQFDGNQDLGTAFSGTWATPRRLEVVIVNGTRASAGSLAPVVGNFTMTAIGTLRTANGVSFDLRTTTPAINGTWGTRPGPAITSFVGKDPLGSTLTYSAGDRFEITFDSPTNQPNVDSKEDIDNLFSFYNRLANETLVPQQIGQNYTGAWQSSTLLYITLLNVTGYPVPEFGVFATQVQADNGVTLTNDAETWLPSISLSPRLTGDWGLPLGPRLLSAVVSAPTGPQLYVAGTTITLTFNEDTNQPDASNTAQIEALFTPRQNGAPVKLGAVTGLWTSPKTLVITVVNATGATPPEAKKSIFNVKASQIRAGNFSSSIDPKNDHSVTMTRAGPAIASFVASGDSSNSVYSVGDRFTISFHEPTNRPRITSKADIDKVFSFSSAIGSDYTGVWTSYQVAVITVLNITGASSSGVAPGTLSVRIVGPLTDINATSEASTAVRDLTGSFGIPPAPKIISVVASDPDNTDAIFTTGDVIAITFDTPTWALPVATKSDIDALFTFGRDLGTGYTGTWDNANTTVTIVVTDAKASTGSTLSQPDPFWNIDGSITTSRPFPVTVKKSAKLQRRARDSDIASGSSDNISGTWGTAPGPSLRVGVLDDADDNDAILSVGDTIIVEFTSATNQPDASTVSNTARFIKILVDTVSTDISVRGTWSSPTALVLTIVTLPPNLPKVWNASRVGVAISGYVEASARDRLPAQTSLPQLHGDPGLLPGPGIRAIYLADENSQPVFGVSNGDTVGILFTNATNMVIPSTGVALLQAGDASNTNGASVSPTGNKAGVVMTKTALDKLLRFSVVLAPQYVGTWVNSTYLKITVVAADEDNRQFPDPTTFNVEILGSAGLQNAAENSLNSTAKSQSSFGSFNPGGVGNIGGGTGGVLREEQECQGIWCFWLIYVAIGTFVAGVIFCIMYITLRVRHKKQIQDWDEHRRHQELISSILNDFGHVVSTSDLEKILESPGVTEKMERQASEGMLSHEYIDQMLNTVLYGSIHSPSSTHLGSELDGETPAIPALAKAKSRGAVSPLAPLSPALDRVLKTGKRNLPQTPDLERAGGEPRFMSHDDDDGIASIHLDQDAYAATAAVDDDVDLAMQARPPMVVPALATKKAPPQALNILHTARLNQDPLSANSSLAELDKLMKDLAPTGDDAGAGTAGQVGRKKQLAAPSLPPPKPSAYPTSNGPPPPRSTAAGSSPLAGRRALTKPMKSTPTLPQQRAQQQANTDSATRKPAALVPSVPITPIMPLAKPRGAPEPANSSSTPLHGRRSLTVTNLPSAASAMPSNSLAATAAAASSSSGSALPSASTSSGYQPSTLEHNTSMPALKTKKTLPSAMRRMKGKLGAVNQFKKEGQTAQTRRHNPVSAGFGLAEDHPVYNGDDDKLNVFSSAPTQRRRSAEKK